MLRRLVSVLGLSLVLSGAGAQTGEPASNGAPVSGLPAGQWIKLCDAPDDPAGREVRPGMEAAFCYVPELKGFLLYGGRTPTFSDAAWVLDPAEKKWKLLFADSSLKIDAASKQCQVLRPGDIVWPADRPGPATGRAAIYDPVAKSVWLYGGWRFGITDWGPDKLGLWRFDAAAGKFESRGRDGAATDFGTFGAMMVLASDQRLLVLAPSPDKAAVSGYDIAKGAWRKLASAPAAPGRGPAMAYDAKNKLVAYFDEHGRTWLYEPAADKWRDAKPAAAPPGRRHAGVWFDSKRGLVFLHGGQAGNMDRNAKYFADTWAFDAAQNTWKDTGAKAPVGWAASRFFRECTAYSPELDLAVMTDPAAGTWAFRPE